ncbi:MAG: chorismate-binding protein [Actinobacteria bacterium]|nr:chorismate-binding protein [Actinomycetota bacterium]
MNIATAAEVTVLTVERPDIRDVLAMPGGFIWSSPSTTLAGWGRAIAIEVGKGPERFARASVALERAWDSLDIQDDATPVAIGSFTFDDDDAGSCLIVPRVLIRMQSDPCVATVIGGGARSPDDLARDLAEARRHSSTTQDPTWTIDADGTGDEHFLDAVRLAKLAIDRGDLAKVVLARTFRASTSSPTESWPILKALMRDFPGCYVFSFDSLIGASPELLVRRDGRSVISRPLAGSLRRGGDTNEDSQLARTLLGSDKERQEHSMALGSVVDALRPLCAVIEASEAPTVLKLANVQHLMSEVRGELTADLSALDLAGALHPTAAVCGVPKEPAMRTIHRVEGSHRGRYAGPIGWVDRNGDGEFAVALRCAELSPGGARLYAGAGIVAGSDPRKELDEVALKLTAMTAAMGISP